jgi:hypothetical protein
MRRGREAVAAAPPRAWRGAPAPDDAPGRSRSRSRGAQVRCARASNGPVSDGGAPASRERVIRPMADLSDAVVASQGAARAPDRPGDVETQVADSLIAAMQEEVPPIIGRADGLYAPSVSTAPVACALALRRGEFSSEAEAKRAFGLPGGNRVRLVGPAPRRPPATAARRLRCRDGAPRHRARACSATGSAASRAAARANASSRAASRAAARATAGWWSHAAPSYTCAWLGVWGESRAR